ncbi:MAG TPA: hypothetical protein VI456_12935 [Polyangia bacterium]
MSLLGTSGTLQTTFEALKSSKRMAELLLHGGQKERGFVVGSPTPTYVILRPEPSDVDTLDVMVMCSAIQTIRVVSPK